MLSKRFSRKDAGLSKPFPRAPESDCHPLQRSSQRVIRLAHVRSALRSDEVDFPESSPSKMPIAAILHLIDTRIEELQRARAILAARLLPQETRTRFRRPDRGTAPTVPAPAVAVTVIPARKSRERPTRMRKPRNQSRSALTGSVPSAPVVISAAEARAAVPITGAEKPVRSPDAWLLRG